MLRRSFALFSVRLCENFFIFSARVYLKNQFAIVGRFSPNKFLLCAIGEAIQLRRKRFPASIDCLNLIVVENLDGNWQPQPGPGRLARNQKIIKGCVTVCERQPWKAENSSCRASWCAVRGMLDTFALQCRLPLTLNNMKIKHQRHSFRWKYSPEICN